MGLAEILPWSVMSALKKKKKKERKKGKEAIKHKAENTLTHIISCVSDWSGYRGLTIDITCVLYVPDLQ